MPPSVSNAVMSAAKGGPSSSSVCASNNWSSCRCARANKRRGPTHFHREAGCAVRLTHCTRVERMGRGGAAGSGHVRSAERTVLRRQHLGRAGRFSWSFGQAARQVCGTAHRCDAGREPAIAGRTSAFRGITAVWCRCRRPDVCDRPRGVSHSRVRSERQTGQDDYTCTPARACYPGTPGCVRKTGARVLSQPARTAGGITR